MSRRNTAARTAILSEFESASTAFSHEMLERRLGESVNRATIYRTLKRLWEDGVVHRVVATDGVQYFALCAECRGDDHHHEHLHFRCLSCERVECMEQEVVVRLPTGYRSVNFNATVSGFCRECAKQEGGLPE
ncbi:Fur family ferric uptake transcriptional regulator [Neolewinella xylanilytica]|uniref:Fur family ferric uptake transcriptional regulator n=1 Tax=Neolewinella xylanilytica TaxID=1514080 RepID=A0A2S6I478_9BACT|nr:transcriptional repressor [Neolewinella xylanilytica]PPK85965.1 Fur family ferric uptake transcriptional regulator [Neolewinella xylanilytica]